MKTVIVKWWDASFYQESYDMDDDDFNLTLTVTAGWLLSKDNEKVVVCQDFDPVGKTVSATTVIPRGAIESMKVK